MPRTSALEKFKAARAARNAENRDLHALADRVIAAGQAEDRAAHFVAINLYRAASGLAEMPQSEYDARADQLIALAKHLPR